MCGTSKPGFTLIELLVVIAIIAVVASVAIPNLWTRRPYYERQQFVRDLNALSLFAWQQALITHKIHKIQFDILKRTAYLQDATDAFNDKGEPVFSSLKAAYTAASFSWPKHLVIKNFFVEGFDEMARSASLSTTEVWYFIMPEGMSQSVIINVADTKDKINNKPRQLGLVLNPFTAQFKEYDAFQK